MSAEIADPSAAAMFARKRKVQKKVFKFNANKVDASQVISTVHIDAPAVSSIDDELIAPIIASVNDSNVDWDDGALASKSTKPMTSISIGNGPSELLDMKALELRRNEQDDIAERMRVEETRAKLAAAKAGMEKEAQRLREEQEAKEAKKKERETAQTSRFGAAAASLSADSSGTANKWIPPHMRNAAPPPSRSSGMGIGVSRFSGAMGGPVSGSSFQKKVDTMDEELFPSLAAADMMIAQEEEQKAAQAAALKAKMSGVSAWGLKKKSVVKKEEHVLQEEYDEADVTPAVPAPIAAPVPTTSSASTPAVKPILKKKKKKDVSTFKAS